MKIFLLGGWGFIGTNILKYIDRHFANKISVVVFDKFPSHPYGEEFNCVESVFSGNFNDSLLISSILESHKFDHIIHSISSTVPATSYNARFDIESNLIPTVELLNSMVNLDVPNIVFISSGGAIYGKSDLMGKNKESDNNFPLSSYGVVKLAIEKYLFQYASLYQIQPLVLRLSNPFGQYHYSTNQGIINVALRAAYSNNNFEVWGNGEARKDYIYIEDFCDILFQLIKKKITNRVLNIGSGQVLKLNDILSEIKNIYPKFSWEYTSANNFDVSHFELDISNLKTIIGDYKFTGFKDGLSEVKFWLETNKKK